MSAGGTFAAVVAEVSRGATVGAAARRLSLPIDLVESILDEAERMGMASHYSTSCSACPSSGAGCDGCPLTRVGHPS